ncbi:ketoacyl-ACP synthase III [Actinomadura sp. KC06]|uniref:beta-ketoacyl-ACP synthase III n=1 Tax=Actinomadura sp. KC06 TaxID=2530369 RepID=UPI00105119B6|nr:beta-ketoacyl-ACP synthase III [Actinomadura sp. KC06]TDD28857.1 ketoacyl-ACP synthase III [Actinomadura sp. KC06]
MTRREGDASVICGLGSSLPTRVVTNEDLTAAGLDTTDEWITRRTGISERRWAEEAVSTGDLATAAGRSALESADSPDADLVLVATSTPDRPLPATAPDVAHRLGLNHCPAFDMAAVCTGFLYALVAADALVQAGRYSRILVIGAETYSRIIDPRDRDTAAIFGDGAGAVLLRPGNADEPGAIGAAVLASDGARSDLIKVTAGGARLPHGDTIRPREERFFQMQGKPVFQNAVARMTEASRAVLESRRWPADSVEVFIGHQANQRILTAVASRLGIPETARYGNIRDVGNTAAASIPLAMAHAVRHQPPRRGARTVLTAFGGGLTWGAVTLTWPAVRTVDRPPEHRPDTKESTG